MDSSLDLPAAVLWTSQRSRLHAIEQWLLEQFHPLAASFSRKLRRSEWRDNCEDMARRAILDRFVVYRIEGSERPERRLLIDPADGMWPPAELSLITPLGITLLGLSVGNRSSLIGADLHEPPLWRSWR